MAEPLGVVLVPVGQMRNKGCNGISPLTDMHRGRGTDATLTSIALKIALSSLELVVHVRREFFELDADQHTEFVPRARTILSRLWQ